MASKITNIFIGITLVLLTMAPEFSRRLFFARDGWNDPLNTMTWHQLSQVFLKLNLLEVDAATDATYNLYTYILYLHYVLLLLFIYLVSYLFIYIYSFINIV